MINLEDGVKSVKPKRGRKSKKDIEAAAAAAAATKENANVSISINIEEKSNPKEYFSSLDSNENANIILFSNTEIETNDENTLVKTGKKRGRKPKGGKIIQQITPATIVKEEKPNVILHLKCSIKDLQTQSMFDSSLSATFLVVLHSRNLLKFMSFLRWHLLKELFVFS